MWPLALGPQFANLYSRGLEARNGDSRTPLNQRLHFHKLFRLFLGIEMFGAYLVLQKPPELNSCPYFLPPDLESSMRTNVALLMNFLFLCYFWSIRLFILFLGPALGSPIFLSLLYV